MLPLTFLNAEQARTVTVAVATLSVAFVYQIPWGRLIAAGVIASSVPLILLATLFQRRIAVGLTAGSIR
jgi:trehalose/maltose transport system permease protein